MTDIDRELMERYIYEVTRKLPKEQRGETERELRELMDDMLESMSLEQMFDKLGDPAVFAGKYREAPAYVIGPEYYDNYIWVIKIVGICVWAGLFLSTIIQMFTQNPDVLYELFNFILEGMIASVTALGSITLIFAIMERQKINLDLKKEKNWAPDMLKPIPDKKAGISRGDCIVSLIFIIIFCCLLLFTPQLFGAYSIHGNDIRFVAVFNLEKWGIILPVFLLSMAIGFVDEIIRLVSGCYNQIVMVSSIVTNSIQLILWCIILKVFPFWNEDFAYEIASQFDETFRWKTLMIEKWNTDYISNIILCIVVLSAIIEVSVTVYKTVRYGKA